jgi:hypothetical protein
MDYKLKDAQPPPKEIIERAVERFRKAGLTAV